MMPPEDEPAWTVLQCPNCASISKCDPAQLTSLSCPNCGSRLSQEPEMPDPNELGLDDEESEDTDLDLDLGDSSPARKPAIGGALISQLGAQAPADPNLDPARIKRTTDEDLVSAAEDRIRVKRTSKRVEKELTSWEGEGGGAAEVPDPVAADGQHRRRERRRPRVLMWLGIAAIAIVPIAVICFVAYGMFTAMREVEETPRPPGPPSPADEARATLTDLEAAALDRGQSKVAYDRARGVAEKFLAAPTWEERVAFVRQPERVAQLMKEFYARPENEDGAFRHRPIKTTRVAVYNSLLLFNVETEDLEKMPLALERIDDETYRVDWESFVGLNEVPWNEIKTRRPVEPFLLRARARKREYYNYGFQEDAWTSWQLEDRRGDHRLFGYVERGGALDIAMRQQTAGNRGAVYVLLKVRFPENAPAGDQVEITEVIAKGWIHPGRD